MFPTHLTELTDACQTHRNPSRNPDRSHLRSYQSSMSINHSSLPPWLRERAILAQFRRGPGLGLTLPGRPRRCETKLAPRGLPLVGSSRSRRLVVRLVHSSGAGEWRSTDGRCEGALVVGGLFIFSSCRRLRHALRWLGEQRRFAARASFRHANGLLTTCQSPALGGGGRSCVSNAFSDEFGW